MIRKYTVVLGLCLPGSIAFGAKPDHVSPVDRDGNLLRVGEAFSLPDGPAWDGSSELIVSDVKDQSVHCYRPVEDSWRKVQSSLLATQVFSCSAVRCMLLITVTDLFGSFRVWPRIR